MGKRWQSPVTKRLVSHYFVHEAKFSDMICYLGNLFTSLCIQWGWLWRSSPVVLIDFISLHLRLTIALVHGVHFTVPFELRFL